MISHEPILLLAVAACLLVAVLFAIVYRLRVTPEEKERRRRTRLNLMGRMGDGTLTDVQGDSVYYCYSIHGVDYTTSQDISTLRHLIPADADLLVGPVTLKYLVRNPANSIVVCENWSGLRIRKETIKHEEVH
ncbi:MAG: hypothetical protein JNN08_17000 [Bryobacterales bacterium]|nr:hypothetical protein [Bryobacterales bacterium]